MIATTAPALFQIEIAGQMDLFAQEDITVTETPAPAPRDRMADAFTAVAVLSDGRTVTRTAPGHIFRYMLEGEWNDGTPGVFELDWCWSLEYAEQSADNIRATWDHVGTVRIHETTFHPYNSPEAKAARRRAGDCGPVAQQEELAAPTVPAPALTAPVATVAPAPRKATRRGPNPNHLTFVAILSTGQTATRSSKTTDYTHVSEVTTTAGETVAHTWHMSEAAAHKNVARVSRFPRIESARVVPVAAAHQYNSAAAKIARATEKAEQAS